MHLLHIGLSWCQAVLVLVVHIDCAVEMTFAPTGLPLAGVLGGKC